MARKVRRPPGADEPAGRDEEGRRRQASGWSFPGLDPRTVVFTHPADWPAWAQRAFAEDIEKGLAAGWWNGLEGHGRTR